MKNAIFLRNVFAIALVASGGACAFDTDPNARPREQEVIWGSATRIKYSQATSAQQELATAVGLLAYSPELLDQGAACPNPDTGTSFDCTWLLKTYTPAQLRASTPAETPHCDFGLMELGLDPFHASACTAFMIGPDTFATAGHCIIPNGYGVKAAEVRSECQNRKVIMRWRESDDNSFPLGNPNILERHVYQCVEVLEHGGAGPKSKQAGMPNDWAVFRVDRPVSGGTGTGGPLTPAREPLVISTSAVTDGQTGLSTIGFSYGRPLRIDPAVIVQDASGPAGAGTFEIEADGAPGLSGGPVLNSSNQVVGIVIAGPDLVEMPDTNSPGNVCDGECFGDVGDTLCTPGLTGLRTMRATKISSLPAAYQPFAASCAARTPGSATYCSATCKCTEGEGHCDSDSECVAGLECLSGVADLFGHSVTTKVCALPQCEGVVSGVDDSCSEYCQCGDGGRGCNEDLDCQQGLHCVGETTVLDAQGNPVPGPDGWPIKIADGVCRAHSCEEGEFGSGSYCTSDCKCQQGAGDCDGSSGCLSGQVCALDHGPMFGQKPTTDVCLPSACEAVDPGTGDYCTAACPCGHGGGDCDPGSQCMPGLTCGTDHGPMFKMSATTDVCMPSACASRTIRSPSYCTSTCPCGHGGGDCDNDSQCMPDLSCFNNHGSMFKMASNYSICLPSACGAVAVGSGSYCTPDCPCGHGGGDCDTDADCFAGLTCATDHGKAFNMSTSTDVCMPSTCAGVAVGSGTYCTPDCPCGHGGGDCDTDADCLPGLDCVDNNGASFGYSSSTDVCVP